MTESKGFKLKPLHIVALVIVVVVIIGGVYFTTVAAAPATVALGDNVSVYYTGSYTNGTVFNTNVGEQLLNFTVGGDQLIPGFEQAVVGMKINQTKNITLTPAEAYGPVNASLIITAPLSEFNNSNVNVGLIVTASNGREGIVTAVNSIDATIDFNPPLAGKTLDFKIKVVAIKK